MRCRCVGANVDKTVVSRQQWQEACVCVTITQWHNVMLTRKIIDVGNGFDIFAHLHTDRHEALVCLCSWGRIVSSSEDCKCVCVVSLQTKRMPVWTCPDLRRLSPLWTKPTAFFCWVQLPSHHWAKLKMQSCELNDLRNPRIMALNHNTTVPWDQPKRARKSSASFSKSVSISEIEQAK